VLSNSKAKIFIFVIVLITCIVLSSPVIALLTGIFIAIIKIVPKEIDSNKLSSIILKTAIVFMGFGLDLNQAINTSKQGLIFSTTFILLTFLIAFLLFFKVKVDSKTVHLLTNGTAICGGSAIAVISPIIGASKEKLSLSFGIVFLLNAIALIIFPLIGSWAELSEIQFGYWVAIAIHDTSSVIGAAATYGDISLEVATTVKLVRALWIIPVSLVYSILLSPKGGFKLRIPWFIFLFILALLVRYIYSDFLWLFDSFALIGKKGMIAALFVIGTGLSIHSLNKSASQSILFGALIWIIISITSLVAVIRLF